MQWYDYMRLTTATLAVLSAYRLARLVKDDHRTYSTRLAEFVWILFASFFLIFIAALEAVLKDSTYRYSILISFLVALAGVKATRMSNEPLQKFEALQDYKTCGFPVNINDTLTIHCDKEIDMDRVHTDGQVRHHFTAVYDSQGHIAQS